MSDDAGTVERRGSIRQRGVGWDRVKEVFKTNLTRRLKRRSLRTIRLIAVDEYATHMGHRYMTVVLDLETGQILRAAQGRDAGALIPFLRTLESAGAHLDAVALDLWPAYRLAGPTVFLLVTVVHDPLHPVAKANRAIDATRRELPHAANIPPRKVIRD